MRKDVVLLFLILAIVLLIGAAIKQYSESKIVEPFAEEVPAEEVIKETEPFEEVGDVVPRLTIEQPASEQIKELPKASLAFCETEYSVGDKFSLDQTVFKYQSSDSKKVEFEDLSSSSLKELPVEEKATFTFEHKEGNFKFVSSTDYHKDNFEIMLRYPCDNKLGCEKSLAIDELFTLGDTLFQYVRSRGYEFYRVEGQMVRIRDTVEGETYVFPVVKTNIFSLNNLGKTYLFEVVSGADLTKGNYKIKLVYPCE